MLDGLDEFVEACQASRVSKNLVSGQRLLLHRNAVGLEQDDHVKEHALKPRLVFTSPPYASVHVLYHRWQYRGRKETPAPYWIARVPDGFYESYYTGGSRTPSGLEKYFTMIERAFSSVRQIMHPDGVVAQLVGFSDTASQLPRYLDAMKDAGFREWFPAGSRQRLDRTVPNRKWYAKLKGEVDASSEILLFHKLR
jgi:hypothetical protein